MIIKEDNNLLYSLISGKIATYTVSDEQYNGIAVVKLYEDGTIKYLTCERAYKNKAEDEDRIYFNTAWYKGIQFYFRLNEIKESLFQEISIGKLLNKMVYVVSKIEDYNGRPYFISYDDIKERDNAEIKDFKRDRFKYHQQVMPKYVVDTMINTWNSYFAPIKGEIKIVECEDIRRYYWRKYYWRNEDISLDWSDDYYVYSSNSNLSTEFDKGLNGSLLGSCMRYGGCKAYMDIYVNNPDIIKMAVWLIDDLVVARCLVWYIDDDKYYDRIYGIDTMKELGLKKHLGSEGYYNCYDNGSDLSVKLNTKNIYEYPYMDTFRYKDGSWFHTVNNNYCELTNTDGTYQNPEDDEDEDTVWSSHENCTIDRDNAFYLDYLDDYVYTEDTVVDSRDIDRLKEDCSWSEIMDKWVYDEDTLYYFSAKGRFVVDADEYQEYDIYYSERNEDYYHRDLVVYVEELEDYLTNEQYDEYKQEIAKEDSGNSEFQLQLF